MWQEGGKSRGERERERDCEMLRRGQRERGETREMPGGQRGRDDKRDGRMDRWKTGESLWCGSFTNVSNSVSPLRDAFVRPDDGGLDVDGVVTHPSQLHGLFQGADHVQSVVSFCTHSQQFQLTRRCLSNCCSRPPEGGATELSRRVPALWPCTITTDDPRPHLHWRPSARSCGGSPGIQSEPRQSVCPRS